MQETGGQNLCGSCPNGSKVSSLLVLNVAAVSVVKRHVGGKPHKLHLGALGLGEMKVGQYVAVAERGEVWNIHLV